MVFVEEVLETIPVGEGRPMTPFKVAVAVRLYRRLVSITSPAISSIVDNEPTPSFFDQVALPVQDVTPSNHIGQLSRPLIKVTVIGTANEVMATVLSRAIYLVLEGTKVPL